MKLLTLNNLALITITLLLTLPLLAMENFNAVANTHVTHDTDEKENESDTATAETPEALGLKLINALLGRDVPTAQELVKQNADVNLLNPHQSDWSTQDNRRSGFQNVPGRRNSFVFDLIRTSPLMLAMLCTSPDTPELVQQLVNVKANVAYNTLGNITPLSKSLSGETPLNILNNRSIDSNYDQIQNQELAHALVFSETRYFSDHTQNTHSFYPELNSLIKTALHDRSNVIISHILLRNPAFFCRQCIPQIPGQIQDNGNEQVSLPEELILFISTFLVDARFAMRELRLPAATPAIIDVAAAQ